MTATPSGWDRATSLVMRRPGPLRPSLTDPTTPGQQAVIHPGQVCRPPTAASCTRRCTRACAAGATARPARRSSSPAPTPSTARSAVGCCGRSRRFVVLAEDEARHPAGRPARAPSCSATTRSAGGARPAPGLAADRDAARLVRPARADPPGWFAAPGRPRGRACATAAPAPARATLDRRRSPLPPASRGRRSRAAFTDLVGIPPMAFLTEWRLASPPTCCSSRATPLPRSRAKSATARRSRSARPSPARAASPRESTALVRASPRGLDPGCPRRSRRSSRTGRSSPG